MAKIQRKVHDSNIVLYNHQKEAMRALDKADQIKFIMKFKKR